MPKTSWTTVKLPIEFNGPIRDFWETTDKGTSYFSKIVVDSVKQWIIDLNKYYNITQAKTGKLIGPNIDPSSELSLIYVAGYIDGNGSIQVHDTVVKGTNYRQLTIGIIGPTSLLNWIKETFDHWFPIQTTRENLVLPCNNTIIVEHFTINGVRALEYINKMRTYDIPLLSRKWDKVQNLVLGRVN